uniref:CSON007522 protein n=1 Tax=Culicoides sonorensis TaxID=179676 RepID=A0A336N0E0_CULSO
MDLDVIPVTEMFRYLSKSQTRKLDTIDERILEISNIDQRQIFHYPELESLQKYRLIFVTLVTAGRLTLLKMGRDHFDYIFVDEAGSATEASTIIPISGLMSYGGFKRRNHVVLAGDPKQLGPIVLHRPAEKLMYGRSLLDRLMERDFYKPHPETKKYNEACITKLLQNFRSHKNILEIPNKLFYDNELIPKAHHDITDIALNKRYLINMKIPIIFHAISGKTLQGIDNPSLYNMEECDLVVKYVNEILKEKYNGKFMDQNEIGIISPYRRQCTEITKKLRKDKKLCDIEVGSVEQFQGQERSVIILSTVRSNTDTIGFLNNPKRLNVSITRAKALLIIVGNPRTLQLDKNWYTLIKYCYDNNVIRSSMKFELRKPVRGYYKDKIKPIPIRRNGMTNGVNHTTVDKKSDDSNPNIDKISKSLNNLSINGNASKITQNEEKMKRDKPKQEQKKTNYSIVMVHKDIPPTPPSEESSSLNTSSASISLIDDIESSFDKLSVSDDTSDDMELLNVDEIDEEIENNFIAPELLDDEEPSIDHTNLDDSQSTKLVDNDETLCDKTLVTEENQSDDTKAEEFWKDLGFNFDQFGFVH